MKKLFLALVILTLAAPARAIVAVQDGDWNAAATWDLLRAPTSADAIAVVGVFDLTVADSIRCTAVILGAGGSITTTGDVECDANAVQINGTFTVADGHTWTFTTAPTNETSVTTRAYTLLQIKSGGTLSIEPGATLLADDDCDVAASNDYLYETLVGSTISVQGEWVGYVTVNEIQPSVTPHLRIQLRDYKQSDIDASNAVVLNTGPLFTWRSRFTDEGNGVLLLDGGMLGPRRIIGHAEADSITIVKAANDSMETYSGALLLFGGETIWEPEDVDDDGIVTRDDIVAAQFDRGDSMVVYMNNDIYHTSTDTLLMTEGIYPSAVISLVNMATIACAETVPDSVEGYSVGMNIWNGATNTDFDYVEIRNINAHTSNGYDFTPGGDTGSTPWYVNGDVTLDNVWFHNGRTKAYLEMYGSAAGADSVFIRDCYFSDNKEPYQAEGPGGSVGSDGHGVEFSDTSLKDAVIMDHCGARRLSDDLFYAPGKSYARQVDCWITEPLGKSNILDTQNSLSVADYPATFWFIRGHAYGQGDTVQITGENSTADSSVTIVKVVDPYITRPYLRSNRDSDSDGADAQGSVDFYYLPQGSSWDGGIVQWGATCAINILQNKISDADSVRIKGVTFRHNCFYPSGSASDVKAIVSPRSAPVGTVTTTASNALIILDSCVFETSWPFADWVTLTASGTSQHAHAVYSRGANANWALRACTFDATDMVAGAASQYAISTESSGDMELYGCWWYGAQKHGGIRCNDVFNVYRSVFIDCIGGNGVLYAGGTAGVTALYDTFVMSGNTRAIRLAGAPSTISYNAFVLRANTGYEPIVFDAAADTVGLVGDYNVFKTITENPAKYASTTVNEATWNAINLDCCDQSYAETSQGANSWTDIFGVGGSDLTTWSTAFRPKAPLRDMISSLSDDLNDIGAYKYRGGN